MLEIVPIKRVLAYILFSVTLFLNIAKWLRIAFFVYKLFSEIRILNGKPYMFNIVCKSYDKDNLSLKLVVKSCLNSFESCTQTDVITA